MSAAAIQAADDHPGSFLKGAIPMSFDLDEPSTASAGVYSPAGQLLRSLFQAVKSKLGSTGLIGMAWIWAVFPAGTPVS